MERVGGHQTRLALPLPFILFYGIPPNAPVNAKVHGWRNGQTPQRYAFDYGIRPAAFNVPAGAVPPAAAVTRMPQAIVMLGNAPTAPGPRSDEYAYQYVWTPFAPAVPGQVVPHGKDEHNFQMPAPNIGPSPDDRAVLRFRWRGINVKTAWDTTVAGTGVAGPYTLDLSLLGANPLPIIPGTVRILAPVAPGPPVVYAESRDWPWPTAVERQTLAMGRMIGDVDPTVDSTINYETGQVIITFNQNVIAPTTNILADFEHEGTKDPIDTRIEFVNNAI